jgi:hypothetical protein
MQVHYSYLKGLVINPFCQRSKLPEGLTQYYNHSDWPTSWICSNDLSEGYNYGSYMRWNAAIVEMDYKTPVLYRNMGIEMFCNFIEDSVKKPLFSN